MKSIFLNKSNLEAHLKGDKKIQTKDMLKAFCIISLALFLQEQFPLHLLTIAYPSPHSNFVCEIW